MRQTRDVICDLDNVKARISELQRQELELMKELLESAAVKFETEMGVKRGDPINTKSGTTFFYDGFVERYGEVYILCHPQKNDGSASKAIRHMWPKDFGFNIWEAKIKPMSQENNPTPGDCITMAKARYQELLEYERVALWTINTILVASLPDIQRMSERLKSLSNEAKYKALQVVLNEALKKE